MKRTEKKAAKAHNNEFRYKFPAKSRRRARESALKHAPKPKIPGPARISPPGSFERIFGNTRYPYMNARSLSETDIFGCVHSPKETPPGMCPCFSDAARTRVKDRFAAVWADERFNVRRRVLECPVCKRRVVARVSFCHDGDCMFFLLPVHKPKRWWKHKTKRPMRDKTCRRRGGRCKG